MRTLIFAFGLLLLPAVVMAAPSQPSSCKVISQGSAIVATGCTDTERKLIAAAQVKPTTKEVDKALQRLADREYLTINTLCKIKGGRRKAARRLVERCYRRAGEGQRLILRNALNDLSDIKACKGVKRLGKQVNCMIDQNNKVLLSLIERTLDAHEAYMKGLKFVIERGCTFKLGRLQCANAIALVLAMLAGLLIRIVKRMLRAKRVAELKEIIKKNEWVRLDPDMSSCGFWMGRRRKGQLHYAEVAYVEWYNATKELKAMQEGQGAVGITTKVMTEGQGNVGATTKLARILGTLVVLMAVALPTTANAKCTSLNALVEMAAEDAIGAKMRFQASMGVASVFTDILADEKVHFKVKEAAIDAMQKLFCADIGDDAETILTIVTLAKAFFNGKDMKEAIERELKAIDIQKGSCGGFLIVLLYGLLGLLGGCRSKLLIVLVALGSMTSLAPLADAACTSAEMSGNQVAAQYGMVLYDCNKDKVSQEDKDAVFEVIWRGYKEKGGFLTKEYIRTRWERAQGDFWSVWKDAPLWQAKIAIAICAKEYLCGVTVKFSEWENYRFQGPKNNNGTVDCGVTQINSGSTEYSCDELQNHKIAFEEQKRIIMIKVRGSASKAVWKKRIHHYNGSGPKARAYGQLIINWAK